MYDQRRIFDIAMSAPKRVFEFKNQKARENLTPSYTPEQLAQVRQLLQSKTIKQLRAEVGVEQSSVTSIYRRNTRKGFSESDSYRDAVAHALLERGILVGELHDSGLLYSYP
jgi:hypothetical protein